MRRECRGISGTTDNFRGADEAAFDAFSRRSPPAASLDQPARLALLCCRHQLCRREHAASALCSRAAFRQQKSAHQPPLCSRPPLRSKHRACSTMAFVTLPAAAALGACRLHVASCARSLVVASSRALTPRLPLQARPRAPPACAARPAAAPPRRRARPRSRLQAPAAPPPPRPLQRPRAVPCSPAPRCCPRWHRWWPPRRARAPPPAQPTGRR